ncbi:MAG TPA: universal stress protein [Paenibacillus sp.]|uniref:universal stress protein n=1 Tax=Paenibacillus sp. TaxID=58172 RepID=UPI0028D0FB01|nr:universal stress protein [Paenibacillus sp.]HUC92128.1 universal stress protein [Paenibacillus sp.]
MAYKNIIAAYDGSEQSLRALNAALELAAERNAALEVLHVYQLPVAVVGEAMIPPPANTTAAVAEEAENVADEIRSIVESKPGARATVTVLQGDAGQQIIETAAKRGADLIVIGSRGNSGLKELFLGSVSHYVIKHTDTAVLVIK